MIEIPKILENALTFLAGLAGVGLWYLGMRELRRLIVDVGKLFKEAME